jgi:4-amino-4-deoxy-L-arabinose transferase-like glycosyltransferase
LLSAGWWVALVSLWPAADRPHIGGSTDDSMLNLIFGYNGFGRITGDETGSVGGGPSGWGPTGWDRMFNASYGGQISWLIPAALIAFGAVLVSRRKAPRTDGRRAAALLWGGWLLLTGAVFSFAQGIIHEYYSVALAPAVGALVGMGAAELWPRRDSVWSRCSLAAAVAASAAWAYVLLGRSPGWLPWLGGAVVACGAISSLALVALPVVRRRLSAGAGALALATILAAPVAYSVDTALTPHTGALPLAGPARLAALAGGPIGRGFRGNGAFAGPPPFARGALPMPGGVLAPANGLGRTAAGPRGSSGGLLEASDPRPALIKALQQHAARYSWVAATVGANSAAGYQLASGDPVMAIGGFNGTDPTPTLSEFERLVGQGRIHYFVAGGAAGRGPVPGGSASTQAIITWVEQSFTPTTIGGTTVYDLSRLS